MHSIARSAPVFLVALTGCAAVGPSREVEQPAVTPVGVSEVPATSAEGRIIGQAGGFEYVEFTTGGARVEEPLPMIIVMHGRGGRTEKFETIFAAFPGRARIIVPHGHPNGKGGYAWWDHKVPGTDPEVISSDVRPVAAQMAAAIVELCAKRPTLGRPVVTGFSQGGMLAFSIAALHPDVVSAAFPMGGLLPLHFAGTGVGATRPPVHAFHGTRDNTVPIESTRWSVGELRRVGYPADLTEYPSLGHQLGDEEAKTAMAQMAAFVSRPGGP
jgi:phospholipase/carboxylesterase